MQSTFTEHSFSEASDAKESDIYTVTKVILERNGAIVDVTNQLNAYGKAGSVQPERT